VRTGTRRASTSLGLLALAFWALVLGCIGAASDAQGGLAFVAMGVIAVALTVGALLLAQEAFRLGTRRMAVTAGILAGLSLVLQLALLGCSWVPFCKPFPSLAIETVATVYEDIMGESPWSRAHRR
jgi:hypothetical protein